MDVESKHFEDLEFQQLERESRLDEEKENLTQQLLREVAEYQRNIVTRKVFFFFFSGLYLRHMKVPRLRVES